MIKLIKKIFHLSKTLIMNYYKILKNYYKILRKKIKYKYFLLNYYLDYLIIIILYWLNKYLYKYLFNNKHYIIQDKFLKFYNFLDFIYPDIIEDYNDIKYTIKRLKLVYYNRGLIKHLIYLFFFLAGVIPFIYFIIFLFFAIKYIFKYMFLILDYYVYFDYKHLIYFYYYVYYRFKILDFFEDFIDLIYKIDTFLFRMNRIQTWKQKIIIYIENKKNEIIQKIVDWTDNFILVILPQKLIDWEYDFWYWVRTSIIYKNKISKYNYKIIRWMIRKEIKQIKKKIKRKLIKKIKRKLIKWIKRIKKKIRKIKWRIKWIFIVKPKNKLYKIYYKIYIKYMNFIRYYYQIKKIYRYYRYNIKLYRFKWSIRMLFNWWFWDYIFCFYLELWFHSTKSSLKYLVLYIWYNIWNIYYKWWKHRALKQKKINMFIDFQIEIIVRSSWFKLKIKFMRSLYILWYIIYIIFDIIKQPFRLFFYYFWDSILYRIWAYFIEKIYIYWHYYNKFIRKKKD